MHTPPPRDPKGDGSKVEPPDIGRDDTLIDEEEDTEPVTEDRRRPPPSAAGPERPAPAETGPARKGVRRLGLLVLLAILLVLAAALLMLGWGRESGPAVEPASQGTPESPRPDPDVREPAPLPEPEPEPDPDVREPAPLPEPEPAARVREPAPLPEPAARGELPTDEGSTRADEPPAIDLAGEEHRAGDGIVISQPGAGRNVVRTLLGVDFNSEEEGAVVRYVNSATAAHLHEAGIYHKCIPHLVEGAPFASLEAISNQPYIGPSALVALKAAATTGR